MQRIKKATKTACIIVASIILCLSLGNTYSFALTDTEMKILLNQKHTDYRYDIGEGFSFLNMGDGLAAPYQYGSIYISNHIGTAYVVEDPLRQFYVGKGQVNSYLGFPLSDTYKTNDGTGMCNEFEGGYIYWYAATGAYDVPKSLMTTAPTSAPTVVSTHTPTTAATHTPTASPTYTPAAYPTSTPTVTSTPNSNHTPTITPTSISTNSSGTLNIPAINIPGGVAVDTTNTSTPIPEDSPTPTSIPLVDASTPIIVNPEKSELKSVKDVNGENKIEISVNDSSSTKPHLVKIPSEIFTDRTLSYVKIDSKAANVIIPNDIIDEKIINKAKNISIYIGYTDTKNITQTALQDIGDRPIFEVKLMVDDQFVPWDNPDSPVVIALSYQPKEWELKSLESIVVQHIDDEGNCSVMPGSRYDKATGKVIFSTTHFSKFAVSNLSKKFEDTKSCPWAEEYIGIMASKGIIKGTSSTTFSPNANIKRADFVIMVVRTFGLSTKFDVNFSDVKPNDYYYKSVGIAKKFGIINGSSDNKFNPQSFISRQDMMTIANNALKLALRDYKSGNIPDLNKYKDAQKISPYARTSIATLNGMGIIKGNNGYIKPLDNLTRSEAAVVVCKINSTLSEKTFFKKIFYNISSLFG